MGQRQLVFPAVCVGPFKGEDFSRLKSTPEVSPLSTGYSRTNFVRPLPVKNIFITGATGNTGREVIRALLAQKTNDINILAGVRNPEEDKNAFPEEGVSLRRFDFEDPGSFEVLAGCDALFLLRPPQLADVSKYFAPLIAAAQKHRVGHIVFLSVQGAERSPLIPHHKIEKRLRNCGIPYTFLRPAYFMQNFTTTLHRDLVEKHRIFLPAGDAPFTLVDTGDIGRVAATILLDPEVHRKQAYVLTSDKRLTFGEMALKINAGTGLKIHYESPNLLRFFREKRKEGVPAVFIGVMIMLHYFPRFAKPPQITGCVRRLTGKAPVSFEEFVAANKAALLAPKPDKFSRKPSGELPWPLAGV